MKNVVTNSLKSGPCVEIAPDFQALNRKSQAAVRLASRVYKRTLLHLGEDERNPHSVHEHDALVDEILVCNVGSHEAAG